VADKFYTCSKCKRKKKGERQFQYSDGGLVCLDCLDQADRREMAKGAVTLRLEQLGGQWHAVNRTGRVLFELERRDGAEGLAVLNRPSFVDEKGDRWAGRTYLASGTGFFQKVAGKAGGRR
jgi:hypothetical protein